MGNMQCPAEDAAHLASFARDICPFPNYSPSPHFINMLSINSSLHLKDHYIAVQKSLTLKQLEDFNQGLRTTFGREGRVTLGGVGVVALSLAVLFDTLARQVKGELVSDSGPIPTLFVKDPRGYYPPHAYTASEYLRLVPHLANNPTRIREVTERYFNQLMADERAFEKLGQNHTINGNEDVIAINWMLGHFVARNMQIHHLRITNGTDDKLKGLNGGSSPVNFIFNLNCDAEEADKEFLALVEKSDNRTQEAFNKCIPEKKHVENTLLLHVAQLEWLDVMYLSLYAHKDTSRDSLIAQREDFDLKANALEKWTE